MSVSYFPHRSGRGSSIKLEWVGGGQPGSDAGPSPLTNTRIKTTITALYCVSKITNVFSNRWRSHVELATCFFPVTRARCWKDRRQSPCTYTERQLCMDSNAINIIICVHVVLGLQTWSKAEESRTVFSDWFFVDSGFVNLVPWWENHEDVYRVSVHLVPPLSSVFFQMSVCCW